MKVLGHSKMNMRFLSAAFIALAGSAYPLVGNALDAGNWECAIKNIGNDLNPHFTLNFLVAPGDKITLTSYGNAAATVVKNDPLTFTVLNPRGARQTTFTWKPDNSMTITGPGLNNPNVPFYNEGTCKKV